MGESRDHPESDGERTIQVADIGEPLSQKLSGSLEARLNSGCCSMWCVQRESVRICELGGSRRFWGDTGESRDHAECSKSNNGVEALSTFVASLIVSVYI